MQVILITIGGSFIGSNFIPYFIKKNTEYNVVNLDIPKYDGDLSNVYKIQEKSRCTFIH